MKLPRLLCVYPAGPIQSKTGDLLESLRNINEGQKWQARIRELGMAPFPVFDDFADIMMTDSTVTVTGEKGIYNQSICWLMRADCIFLIPGWEKSTGAIAELEIAKQLGMPFFDDISELRKYQKMYEAEQTH